MMPPRTPNLVQLVGQLEGLAPLPLWRKATWVFCDRCCSSVDTDLVHADGHHDADDGDFYCADCWRGRCRVSVVHAS